jgi:hypothetical protein
VVTVVLAKPPAASTVADVGATVTEVPRAWLMVKEVVAPPAFTTTLPDRGGPVLAATAAVREVPLVPLVRSRATHSGHEEAIQDAWLVVTVVVAAPPPATTPAKVGETDTVSGPADWVRVNVAVAPPAVKMTFPDRSGPVLGQAVTLRVLPETPPVRLRVTHGPGEEANQIS